MELDSRPRGDVTVNIGGTTGTDVTVSPDTLTFVPSEWNTAKTVTVTAGQDSDAEDDSVTLTHTVTSTDTLYEGISADSVDVTVDDDEDASVSVTVEFGVCDVQRGRVRRREHHGGQGERGRRSPSSSAPTRSGR